MKTNAFTTVYCLLSTVYFFPFIIPHSAFIISTVGSLALARALRLKCRFFTPAARASVRGFKSAASDARSNSPRPARSPLGLIRQRFYMLLSGGFFVKHAFRLPRPAAAAFALALLFVAAA